MITKKQLADQLAQLTALLAASNITPAAPAATALPGWIADHKPAPIAPKAKAQDTVRLVAVRAERYGHPGWDVNKTTDGVKFFGGRFVTDRAVAAIDAARGRK